MKKLTLLTLTIGILGVQTGLAAPAADQPWNQYHGVYVEANGGTNIYFGSVVINGDTSSSSGSQGWGWQAALGYRFSPHFGIEGGFMQNYAEYDTDDQDHVEANTNIPYVAMRFTVPIGDRAAFFAKLGGMYAWLSGTASNNNDSNNNDNNDNNNNDDNNSTSGILLPYTGIGFSYALTQKLEVSAQFQGAMYGIVNAGLLSAGLTYHF